MLDCERVPECFAFFAGIARLRRSCQIRVKFRFGCGRLDERPFPLQVVFPSLQFLRAAAAAVAVAEILVSPTAALLRALVFARADNHFRWQERHLFVHLCVFIPAPSSAPERMQLPARKE